MSHYQSNLMRVDVFDHLQIMAVRVILWEREILI